MQYIRIYLLRYIYYIPWYDSRVVVRHSTLVVAGTDTKIGVSIYLASNENCRLIVTTLCLHLLLFIGTHVAAKTIGDIIIGGIYICIVYTFGKV